MPDHPSNGVVSFGLFEVNLQAGELRRNGSKIRLQEQPFQVLALLLERPGEVVSREELRGKLWPADTFVDFDHGLNAAVKRLRDALGDSAENPRFIETLARRGYRFIAPVGRGADTPEAKQGAPVAFGDAQFQRRWTKAAAGLAVLAMGTGAGWVAARKLNPRVQLVEQRLTANPMGEPVLAAAISPEGRYLAFADKAGVFLRNTGTGETHQLALPEGFNARPSSWFPDGTHVLLTSATTPADKMDSAGESPTLWNASIFGGAPRKLVDKAEAGAVSPDGAHIIFLRNESLYPEIWWMQADGQQSRKLLGEPQHFYSSLAWSPSGDSFAFLDETFHPRYDGSQVSVCIFQLNGNRTETVLTSARLTSGLAWTPDGRLIYSETEPPPNQADSNLWALRIDSVTHKAIGHAARLTNGPDGKTNISASVDGKHLTFLRQTSDANIYVANADVSAGTLSAVEPLHLEQHRQLPYAWTPDNQSVIFISDRDGPFHLFKQSADQLTADLLFGDESSVSIVRPSPDYSSILFLLAPKPGEPSSFTRLMEMPYAGGTPRQVLADDDIHNFQCARAPSAVCVYSRYVGDRLLLLRFDLATGKTAPLAEIPGPEWHNWTLSPDGSTLALANWRHIDRDPAIELLSIKTGGKRLVTAGHQFRIVCIDFASDARSIWTVVQDSTGTRTLLNVGLDGRVKPMFRESQKVLGWAIPSPDGHRLAFWESSGTSNAWLLQGF